MAQKVRVFEQKAHFYIKCSKGIKVGVFAIGVTDSGLIYVGSSLCSQNQNFTAKIGKDIAYGRMRAGIITKIYSSIKELILSHSVMRDPLMSDSPDYQGKNSREPEVDYKYFMQSLKYLVSKMSRKKEAEKRCKELKLKL